LVLDCVYTGRMSRDLVNFIYNNNVFRKQIFRLISVASGCIVKNVQVVTGKNLVTCFIILIRVDQSRHFFLHGIESPNLITRFNIHFLRHISEDAALFLGANKPKYYCWFGLFNILYIFVPFHKLLLTVITSLSSKGACKFLPLYTPIFCDFRSISEMNLSKS
jgi:hypothetical protein